MDFWQKLRADFPISKDRIYLDHASAGPIPRPVYEKSLKYYEEHYRDADYAWPRWIERGEAVREKAARFIHADASEIAFVTSTSQAMNLIAEVLAGEGPVLMPSSEFPSSTVPWLWRKANIVWQEPENFKFELKTLRRLLTPDIKTMVTSFVQYSSGFRQDMDKLSELKGQRYLVLNATQGFGAFPIDVKRWKVDFLTTMRPGNEHAEAADRTQRGEQIRWKPSSSLNFCSSAIKHWRQVTYRLQNSRCCICHYFLPVACSL